MGRGSGRGGIGSVYHARAASTASFLSSTSMAPHRQAIAGYTGSSYDKMNSFLREGESAFRTKYGENSLNIVKNRVVSMQTAMRVTMESGNVFTGKTFRGQGMSAKEFEEMVSTKTYITKSFTSTSISSRVARDFASGADISQGGRRVIFHYSKSSGVPVEKLTIASGEKESILPIGQRYRYRSHKQRGGYTHVYLDPWE